MHELKNKQKGAPPPPRKFVEGINVQRGMILNQFLGASKLG
jgi:hypothetical protein